MTNISFAVQFFLHMAKVQSMMNRRFDAKIRGMGFSDFTILYHLSQERDEKLRRIDLAEKVGLTASGITRLLAPMEKIGLIKRESDGRDARVSYVVLTKSGKRMLEETVDDAELIAEAHLPITDRGSLKLLSSVLSEMAKTA